MKKKLMILPLVALVALGGAYKFVLAKPKAEAKPKVEGTVYILGKEFLVNLQGGRFAKLTAAIVIDPTDTAALGSTGGESASTPPEGFGTMPQEAVVRDIITNDLTGAKDTDLINRKGRIKMKDEILKDLNSHTDVKVKDVLFTDVTVQ